MREFKFNLNEKIKVKLKPEGFAFWKQYDDKIYMPFLEEYIKPISWYKERADKDGYVEFQAWQFMKIFGESIEFGRLSVFDIDILINEFHLTPMAKF